MAMSLPVSLTQFPVGHSKESMSIIGDLTLEEQDALCEPYFPTPPPDCNLLELLQSVFKLDKFRPAQLDAIRYVISGRDCVVRMATGSGKSLLWQVRT